MQFTTLLKQLTGFLDLGKVLAQGIPGIIFAMGILLWISPKPDYLRAPELRAQVDTLESRRDTIQTQIARLSADSARHHALVDAAGRLIESVTATLGQLRGLLSPALSGFVEADLQSRIRALEARLDTISTGRLNPALDSSATATANLTVARQRLDETETDLDSMRQRLRDTERFGPSAALIIDSLGLVLLVGFFAGIILDPISKQIFLQWILVWRERKQTFELEWLRRWTAELEDEVKEREGRAIARDLLMGRQHASYWIGKRLISQDEHDYHVGQYYRYSEVAIGLILPTIVLGGAIASRIESDLPRFLIWLAVFLPVLLLCVFFYRVGVKRYYEFRARLAKFISGRYVAWLEEKEQASSEVQVLKKLQQHEARLKTLVSCLGEMYEKECPETEA